MARIALGLLVLFSAQPAWAISICECRERQSVEEEFKRANVVFTGVVQDRGRILGDNRLIEMSVQNSFKGNLQGEVRVRAYMDSVETVLLDKPGCSINLREGKSYIVFGYNNNRRGPAYVDGCTYTLPTSMAYQVIEKVKALSKEAR